MTSGMEKGNTPERGDFEIGFKENGNGYLKLPIYVDGEVEQFTIPKEEVEAYRQRRNNLTPIPSLPDGVDREPEVKVDGDWGPGESVNTGGGIFCRIWSKEIWIENIEHEYEVGVVYQLPTTDGITIDVFTEDGSFIGTGHRLIFDNQRPDAELQQEAKQLIKRLEDGELDGDIKEVIRNYQS